MLPGDPMRVYNRDGAAGVGDAQGPGHPEAAPEPAAKPDPTTAKSTEVNPFTGEGT